MRFPLLFVVLTLALPAAAQDFAVVSPAAAQALAAQKDSPAGKQIISAATSALSLTPHPMARVHTEGTLAHQGIRDESEAAERDFDKMLALALACRLTGTRQFCTKTEQFLDAWVAVYKVSGNPIDETRWQPVILAFDLVRDGIPDDLLKRCVDFFRGMATNYLDWMDHNPTKDPYNWSSHRVKLAVLAAYETGDKGLIDRAAKVYRRQVKENIKPSGEVLDYEKRDALHYVVYDLEPLSMAAIAAQAHGQDWFHTAATGAPSVEQGMDWLIPFATGEKTHQEFVHSTVKFDADRDKAGEKGYSGQWNAATSVNLLGQATWLDAKYAAPLQTTAANAKTGLQPWLVLLEGASVKK